MSSLPPTMPSEFPCFVDDVIDALEAALCPMFALLGCLLVWAGLILTVQGSVNKQLGFDYATPQFKGQQEIFVFTRVEFGGPMARAGVLEGDRVVLHDVSKLYALLLSNQGGTAHIPIERDGETHEISVGVPPMELPFSPRFRRWLYGRNKSAREKLIH